MRRARPAALALLLVGALAGVGCGRSQGPVAGQRLPVRPRALPPGVLPWVGRLAIDWTRGSGPREHILIGPGGLEIGPAEGPLTRYLYGSREREDDLRFFVGSFAPFAVAEAGEALAFRGAGPAAASPAERRMIVTWAHRIVAEAVGGRGGGAYGVALSWHRGGDAYGGCDEVVVSLTGEVRAGACDGAEGGAPWRGRLTEEQLRRLYGWFDAWAPFQIGGEADSPATAPVRLVFAGQGQTPATSPAQSAVADFAATLFRELAARHPAPPAPAPPVRPVKPGGKGAAPLPPPAPPPPAPAEPAGPRLLRPEQRAGTSSHPLAMPEKPPPPPKPAAPPSPPPPPEPSVP